ncbi:MAG: cytochrome o ubiquinol oxidase subunit [Candidatus Saccharibacteria bacterium]|nr:cytochrome o ubiquinol oxidase subunit [Candidatus Saccharibacteria bacterium]
MATSHSTIVSHHEVEPGSLAQYVFGFVWSLILTGVAYWLVSEHVASHHNALPHRVVLPILGALAIVQAMIQLIFFLHVGEERKPRWKSMVLWLTIVVILIVVLGSLWVMDNLNRHMRTQTEITNYMQDQDSL